MPASPPPSSPLPSRWSFLRGGHHRQGVSQAAGRSPIQCRSSVPEDRLCSLHREGPAVLAALVGKVGVSIARWLLLSSTTVPELSALGKLPRLSRTLTGYQASVSTTAARDAPGGGGRGGARSLCSGTPPHPAELPTPGRPQGDREAPPLARTAGAGGERAGVGSSPAVLARTGPPGGPRRRGHPAAGWASGEHGAGPRQTHSQRRAASMSGQNCPRWTLRASP